MKIFNIFNNKKVERNVDEFLFNNVSLLWDKKETNSHFIQQNILEVIIDGCHEYPYPLKHCLFFMAFSKSPFN